MKATETPAMSSTGDEGFFSWYRDLNGKEKRTFWSCKAGYGLDGMDTQFLSFVIPTIITLWGLSKAEAGTISTVTLWTSAIGGWLAGIISDRFGRVRALQITIVWFALFTVLCGLTQNFTQLLVARGLMGLGMGGEWTAGAILIGEVIRARDRGKAVGMVQSGWAIGWGISALLYSLMFYLLPETLAWRALFLFGILPAVFVIFIRRFVEEPEVYVAQKRKEEAKAEHASFLEIFSPKILSITLRAALLTTGAQGGYYAITQWLPTFLKTERHLTVLATGGYLAMVIFGSYVGYIVSAFLTDYLGRKKNFILFALGSACIALAYTHLAVNDSVMLFLGFPLGFFVSGVFSGMGSFLTELFPTRIRGSGQGFAYNMGRAVGALFPYLIGVVSHDVPLGETIGLFAAVAYGLMVVAAFSLPETRGKQLEA